MEFWSTDNILGFFFQNIYGTQRHEDRTHHHRCIQSTETLDKMPEEEAEENPI